ncbi:MAG: nicotinate (nicotinamide) nucleotide adenylyltransferase [Nitrospirota bacterium]|nr:nicotinate (nicotinamide) nucleotide adenylyltransferase [Nitrospirota bacterium]
MPAPRIGIFGGTFNPVHTCHLRVAEACRKALALDRIRFIPAGEPPLKRHDLAPAAHRLEMVRLATEHIAGFEVDAIEVRRSGPSWTIDTLDALCAAFPATRWTLILGLDALLRIDAWHRPDAVLRRVPLAVLFRPGARFGQLAELSALAGVDFSPLLDCCGRDPEAPLPLTSADGIRLTLVPIPPCPVSGTAIRKALTAGTEAVEGLPPTVAAYIRTHRLYR